MATGNVAQPPEQWVADAAASTPATGSTLPAGVANRHHDSLLSMLFRGSRPSGHLVPAYPYAAAFAPHLMYSYAAEAFGVGMPTANSHALPLPGGGMLGSGSLGAQKIDGGSPHLPQKGASQFLPPAVAAQAPLTPPPLSLAPSLLHQSQHHLLLQHQQQQLQHQQQQLQQQQQALSGHKDSAPAAAAVSGANPSRSPHLPGESAASARALTPKALPPASHAKRHSSSSTEDALNFVVGGSGKETSVAKRSRPSAAAVDRGRRGSSASPSLTSSSSSAMAPPRPPSGSPSVHHGQQPSLPQPQAAAAQPPPPQPNAGLPHRAAYFRKGSVVQLTDERLKRVEDLTTDDFVACASASQHLRLDSSTVAKIVEDRAKGTALLTFHVGDSRVQVEVEALLEHPFFVYHRGWASACPSRTMEVYQLACRQLAVGDCFISLTRREQQQPPAPPPQPPLLATVPMRVQQQPPAAVAKPALGPMPAHSQSQPTRRQSLSVGGGSLQLRPDGEHGGGSRSPAVGRVAASATNATVIRDPRPE